MTSSVHAHDDAEIDPERVHRPPEHLDRFRRFAGAVHEHVDQAGG